jgi:hypothetical protein
MTELSWSTHGLIRQVYLFSSPEQLRLSIVGQVSESAVVGARELRVMFSRLRRMLTELATAPLRAPRNSQTRVPY